MRSLIPKFGQTREPVTLVDWVTVNPLAGWTAQFGTATLVPAGQEPEGYVPGGGRCIRIAQDPLAAPTSPRVSRTLATSVNLVDENTVIQCPVYHPLPYSSPTFAGLRLDFGSGGSLTNSYNKTFYPSGTDDRQGWALYSYPLQTALFTGTISMTKVGTPVLSSMNFMRLLLENQTFSATQANEIWVGPITARRRQRTLVTISTDDGHISNYDDAGVSIVNEMNARGFKGNAFIITGVIQDVPTGNRMSWSQVAELQNVHGWTIGAHGTTGANFLSPPMPQPEIQAEVYGSIDTLRARGFNVRFFAWNGGLYDEFCKQMCRNRGIELCYDITTGEISYAPWQWGSGDYGCQYRFGAENTATSTTGTTGAINLLDEAIKVGGNLHLYMHVLTTGASAPVATNLTEFRTMLDAIRLRVRQGLCEVVTLDEFYDRQVSGRATN
jgi:hypothetical protein